MNDGWAALALLAIVVLGFITVMERFDLGAGAVLLLMLVAPFSILLVFMTRGGLRTTRGWDRPEEADQGSDADTD